MTQRRVIALAGGTGNLGRYLCEELSKDDRYTVALLTRKTNLSLPSPNITIHPTDYSESSILSILNSTHATALISTLSCADDIYVPLHTSLLNACTASTHCKRFIPSEWAGNIEAFPNIPRAYGRSRVPFREILKRSSGVEWTLLNHGWFMDYFLPEGKSYMKYLGGEFPIDPVTWKYMVLGTGDEPQAWTCGRDVARAVAELLDQREWEPVTYIAGEWGTFNEAAVLMERFYGGPFIREYRSLEDVHRSLESPGNETELAIAEAAEWALTGATACPREKTLRQREKFFSALKLLSIEDMLKKADAEGHV